MILLVLFYGLILSPFIAFAFYLLCVFAAIWTRRK